MRLFFALVFLISVTISCKKNDPGTGSNPPVVITPDYTVVPNSETVNTELVGYVTAEDNTLLLGTNWMHLNNQQFTIMGNGMFYTNMVNTDKYNTKIFATLGGPRGNLYINHKSFPVTSALKNYVRLKVLPKVVVGTVTNRDGGTIALQSKGNLSFGKNAFYILPQGYTPGYFGPELNTEISFNYLDPENEEFALKLPAYPTIDSARQRWFLKSFGSINLEFNSASWGDEMDFYHGASADLKLAIPQGMLNEAPDSVPIWKFNNGEWVRGGIAKKASNFYEAKIDKAGAWNISTPVKGVYLTVNLRTDSNATVTNTVVRIKSNNRVIVEGRADANGDAVCFVPSNEPLTAEVICDERSNSTFRQTFAIGAVTKSSSVTLKISTDLKQLSTIIGRVYNCNNEPVKSGIAKILMGDNREYFVPVVDGKFSTAVWINFTYNYKRHDKARVQVTDHSSTTQGEIVFLDLFPGESQKPNFYTCQNSNFLYSNYSVDNVNYELKDNVTSPSVYMLATRNTSYSWPVIKTTNNGLGVNFSTWATSVGEYSSTIPELMVNGKSYKSDDTKETIIAYTRFDGMINGIIEGWYSIYYKDEANVTHRVTGNFKVKRTF